jgi:aldehyde dehydrogenase (NAD+)
VDEIFGTHKVRETLAAAATALKVTGWPERSRRSMALLAGLLAVAGLAGEAMTDDEDVRRRLARYVLTRRLSSHPGLAAQPRLARLPFGGNGKSGNGSRQSGIWVLDQFTRWQAMNWLKT